MRLGKDALFDKDLDKAIDSFERALIEKPSDENAKLLLDKASSEKTKLKEIIIFKEYHEALIEPLKEYIETKKPLDTEESYSSFFFKEELKKLENVQRNVANAYYPYQNNEFINEIHIFLTQSIEEALNATAALTISFNLIEKGEKTDGNVDLDKYTEYSDIFKKSNEQSKELIFKYVNLIKEYRENNNLI